MAYRAEMMADPKFRINGPHQLCTGHAKRTCQKLEERD